MRRRAPLWRRARERCGRFDEEIQQFELSSQANVLAAKVLGSPMRDGMFEMVTAWRVRIRGRVRREAESAV